jgi:hypothetical protein
MKTFPILFGAMVTACSVSIAAGETPSAAKQDTDAAARTRALAEMRRRAERTKIHTLDGDRQIQADLVAEPLVRYSDQPRVMTDATMWALGKPGRPAAILKVEAYRRDNGELVWLYSMGSTSEGLISAEWGDGHRWKSKSPGISWQSLLPAPAAKDSPALRLRQMKELSRRFAVESNDSVRGKEVLRLLPQPIHRYGDPNTDIVDAAIFGFTSYGTNPNALLLIELHKDATGTAWRFAPARATDAGLDVRLDGKQVWTVPASTVGPVELDSWLYFWEAPGGVGN